MNKEPIFIEPDNFFEGIVVGGGTCGLAVSSRLCESKPGSLFTDSEHQRFHWLKQRGHKSNKLGSNKFYQSSSFHPSDLLIIDSTNNKFLSQWDNQFKSCQIPYLRSPMFFHVDPSDIDGMTSYAYSTNRENELMEITNVVGKEISKHKLKQKKGLKKNGLIDINHRDWKDYYRPSTKLFHDYCESVVDRYNLKNSIIKDEVIDIKYRLIQYDDKNIGKGVLIYTKLGKIFGCKFVIIASGHRGKSNYPIKPFGEITTNTCHTSHLFTNQVKFLDDQFFKRPKLKNIVIVGGGLTSAQLANVACNDPTVDKVYLLFRSPIKIKHFDFHLDWVSKYKNFKKSIFFNQESNELKYEMINDAREGGSINPEYYKKLKNHLKSGKLKWFTETVILNQEWNGDYWNLELSNDLNLTNIDYIYFATGITNDIESIPFLKSIIEEHPIEFTKGFPSLTDNLQWNTEVPLFFIGKNASLQVGPTSANLDGARLGAERIGWYLQNMKLQGELSWSTTNEANYNSFNTQLDLASGKLNWFELLECNA
ncbi:hypothetical protein KGF54_002438 [Candida jiufengensis]|uniref:uncharacterized protein n=1 Tax=Candida jiufengensis TaxID=497108 RepID=UPI0022240A4B|nr:uncharacterized protein KGF54_002438 [Candida jiufengensis]KAI5954662.1 hypothetical protein KGF54_002438 [Candida jiufengensis]